MGLVIAWKVCQVMPKHILTLKSQWNLKKEHEKYKFKRVVAQVSQTDRFALYSGIRVDLMLEWGS
ncbi:uncharacterized protein G2W53_027057 [Senna tora]|uniref:Uncharacterized protein n=1 Tax=Senna tora TaxID=362788 RepID=A0A834WG81_9FABA|nr:uncharacterized protein G2W53_027057 [Senna tora]